MRNTVKKLVMCYSHYIYQLPVGAYWCDTGRHRPRGKSLCVLRRTWHGYALCKCATIGPGVLEKFPSGCPRAKKQLLIKCRILNVISNELCCVKSARHACTCLEIYVCRLILYWQ
jgi:hypothetical protein